MGLGQEVRLQLVECGNCINCKLLIWTEHIDSKQQIYINKIKTSNGNVFYTVRCNWLKAPVFEPVELKKCEGKKKIGESNE